jgi:cytochrome c oxidase subunit 2
MIGRPLGRTAIIISVSYVVATLLVTLIGVAVAASTRGRREADVAKLREREKSWFVVCIVLLTALLFATIFFTPYGKGAGKAGAQVVTVKGVQFAWLVHGKPRAGEPVEFRLSSGDVNHNLGVYTENWKLLFQVQVVPGKTQKYVYTFKQPGTYRLVCLEFCGLDHHLMNSQLQVGA